eukprot:1072681-Rhodomonas_salina.1
MVTSERGCGCEQAQIGAEEQVFVDLAALLSSGEDAAARHAARALANLAWSRAPGSLVCGLAGCFVGCLFPSRSRLASSRAITQRLCLCLSWRALRAQALATTDE